MSGRIRVPKRRTCCSSSGDSEEDRNREEIVLIGRVSYERVPRQRSGEHNETPLLDRVREYAAVPRSGLKIRAVFFLEDGKTDFVYGFIRATEHPSSVVVFASNGDILIPSQVQLVVRLLKIPSGLHVKFETHQSLHVVEDTTVGQNENSVIRLRSRADRDNNQEYRAKVQFLRIPWESMRFLMTTPARMVTTVNLENPWRALR